MRLSCTHCALGYDGSLLGACFCAARLAARAHSRVHCVVNCRDQQASAYPFDALLRDDHSPWLSHQAAEKYKEQGNEFFKDHHYPQAIEWVRLSSHIFRTHSRFACCACYPSPVLHTPLTSMAKGRAMSWACQPRRARLDRSTCSANAAVLLRPCAARQSMCAMVLL